MTFDVRPATLADEGPFLDLLEQLFDPPGSRPDGYTRERGSEGLRAIVANPEADALLAFDGDRLVGLATVYCDILSIRFGKRCWLQDLVTDSTERSRGVGATLLATAGEWARKHGCNHLELTSGLGRVDAHRFYEREGMTRASYSFFVWLD
jgi:GNAT superfamily N-acetyltransferase